MKGQLGKPWNNVSERNRRPDSGDAKKSTTSRGEPKINRGVRHTGSSRP